MKRLRPFVLVALGFAVGALIRLAILSQPVHAQGGGYPFSCGLDNIGATLTLCQSNGDPSMRLYVTDIVATSTTATAGAYLLQYGTGANCVTGTTSLFPSAAAAIRFAYPGSATAPVPIQFRTPLVVPAGKDLCVLGKVTDTVTIQINGERRP